MSSENVSFGCRGSLYPIIIAVMTALLHVPPPAHADSFVMTSGKIIDGTIASGSDISVFIKDKNGLLNSVLVADIAEVRIDLRSGEQVVGRLAGFRDGVYEILSGGWAQQIKDGQVVQSLAVRDDDAPAVVPNAGGPAVGIDTKDPASEPEPTDKSDMLRRAPL